MVDAVFKIIGAVVAYFVTDKVVKHYTGQHIHDHALQAWNKVRDKIVNWAHVHKHLNIVKFVAVVDNIVQSYTSVVKKHLRVKAIDNARHAHHVTTEEVSEKDLQELGIQLSGETDITQLVYKA